MVFATDSFWEASLRTAAIAMILSCAVLTGCVTSPFPEPEPYIPGSGAPADVPARFAAKLAPRFEQVNAIVFRFRMQEMAALGMASVDRTNRSFAVTCMTPIGVKLFDVVCEQGHVEGRFVHPELAKRGGDLAQAAGGDLLHTYLDLQPPAGTPFEVRDGRLVFAVPDATGVTEYCYAWRDGRLAEKVRLEQGRRVWTVAYRGYAPDAAGLLVPTGILVENRKYGYRLVVSAREEPSQHERPAGKTPSDP